MGCDRESISRENNNESILGVAKCLETVLVPYSLLLSE